MQTRTSSITSTSKPTYYINIVVDTSASMDHLRQALKSGVKEFVDNQKKNASDENRLSSTFFRLVTFNTKKCIIYDGRSTNKIKNCLFYLKFI